MSSRTFAAASARSNRCTSRCRPLRYSSSSVTRSLIAASSPRAEHLFSPDLSTLTDKRKRLTHLETRRDYFRELMQRLLPDLMGDPDLSSGVTADAVEKAVTRIEAELSRLAERRTALMAEVRDQAHSPQGELGLSRRCCDSGVKWSSLSVSGAKMAVGRRYD